MLKGMTAQMLLRQVYRVRKGNTLLIHAAVGGVGSILVQWAKHLGATVIAVVGSNEKAQRARELGADHVLLVRRGLGCEDEGGDGRSAASTWSTTPSARTRSSARWIRCGRAA